MNIGIVGNYDEPFLEGVKNCLVGDDSLSDFTSLCALRLSDLGSLLGVSIDIDYSIEDDNAFLDTCDRLFKKKFWSIQEKMKRFRDLILNEDYSEENDKEFRKIQEDADKIIRRTCAIVDRICKSILNNSKIDDILGNNT